MLGHARFNLLISVLSQLTPLPNHLEALVQVQGFHQPPLEIPSRRFIHVKPPESKFFFRIARGLFCCIFANWIMMWDGMNIDQISKLNFPIFRLWCKRTHRLSWPIQYAFNNSQRSVEVFKTQLKCTKLSAHLTSLNPFFPTLQTSNEIHIQGVSLVSAAVRVCTCGWVSLLFSLLQSHYLQVSVEMCLYTSWTKTYSLKDAEKKPVSPLG